MIKQTLKTLFSLLVILAIVIYFLPAEFTIERSLTMAAPPAVPYRHVVDFRQWARWSPWDSLDPAMTKEFSGTQGTQGAGTHWSGNDQVGEGTMTLKTATPNTSIVIGLEFLKPFAATNTTTFEFVPEGDRTKVTWRMEGTNTYMARALGLFKDMDAMIGTDFEKGLLCLKVLSECSHPTVAPAQTPGTAASGSDGGR